MKRFDPADVAEFVNRPWGVLEKADREYWATQSAQAKFRIGCELRERAARLNPGWPTAEDRQKDLEAHQRLSALLLRASRGLR